MKKFLTYIKIIVLIPLFFLNKSRYRQLVPSKNRNIITFLIKKFYFKNYKLFEFNSKNNTNFISLNLKNNGYHFFKLRSLDSHIYLMNYFEKKFRKLRKNIDKNKSLNHMENLDFGHDFIYNQKLKKFILQKKIYLSIASYLGFRPILHRVYFMYSFKKNYLNKDSSQYFHSDYEDLRGIKLFVNLTKISKSNGPFTFINKKISEKIYKNTNYSKNYKKQKRLSDEIIEKYTKKKNWKNNSGNKGDCLMIDTNSCLHFGSRLKKGERVMVCFFFLSPFSYIFKKPFYNYLNKIKKNKISILFSHLKFYKHQ